MFGFKVTPYLLLLDIHERSFFFNLQKDAREKKLFSQQIYVQLFPIICNRFDISNL